MNTACLYKTMIYTKSVQGGPFSNLHKAGIPLSLCVHLKEKGLLFGEAD